MSMSVLSHGFGVRGYRHEKTLVVDGRLVMQSVAAERVLSVFGVWVAGGGAQWGHRAGISQCAGREPAGLHRVAHFASRLSCVWRGSASRRDVCRSTSQ